MHCTTMVQQGPVVIRETHPWLSCDNCLGLLSPGVQDTHQEEDQSHNALRIPPLDHWMVLASRGGTVEADDA